MGMFQEAKERTNLRTALFALVCLAAGTAAIYGAATSEWLSTHPGLQILTRELGSLIIAAGAVSTIWELWAKRALLGELMAIASLAEELRAAGLTKVTKQFLRGVEWPTLFRDVTHLDVFAAYASTWRGSYTPELRSLALRRGARVRFVLPDSTDLRLVAHLANRFGIDEAEVRRRIQEAVADLREIFRSARDNGVDFSIFVTAISPLLSLYRFDNTVVIAVYRHRRGRAEVPTFVARQGGFIYDFVSEEFESFFDGGAAKRIFPEDA